MLLNEAAEADPNNADAYFHRAVVKAKIKQYKEAFKDFNQAIRLDSEHEESYSKRGVLRKELKQYKVLHPHPEPTLQLEITAKQEKVIFSI